MADQFVGEIRVFPFNFAPTGWALCNGQLLPISQNTALFSLLGTQFGGNGTSNFALPNFQGQSVIGQGNGPGMTPRSVGDTFGEATVTLLTSQVPTHTHALGAVASATTALPSGAALAPPSGGQATYRIPGTLAAMAAESISPAGGGGPHNNLQPYLTLNFCIALQGIFPARS